MAKIKLTKNELKKQKDALKMYSRYLPTLLLKKQQLQGEIQKIKDKEELVRSKKEKLYNEVAKWIELFGAKDEFPLQNISVKQVRKGSANIAGVAIPTYDGADFELLPYNLFTSSLWIDKAFISLKDIIACDLEYGVLEEQVNLLSHELKITTQRVNLFEKVKIPQTKEIIKKITIYLGDQQTAAVVRGKISKNKLIKVAVA